MGRSTQVGNLQDFVNVRGKMRATFKDEYGFHFNLVTFSMRISRESMFNILNLQTLAPDGNLVSLFCQRGEPEYVIEVIGQPSS